MALSSRRRYRAVDYWPGFVDALSTLLLVIIFLLTVFMIAQFLLGREVTGKDTALLDNVDVITDATAENPNGSCEKVVRKDPKPSESKSEDAQQAPADANKQS